MAMTLRLDEDFVQLLNGDKLSEVRGDVRRVKVGWNKIAVRKVLRKEIMGALK